MKAMLSIGVVSAVYVFLFSVPGYASAVYPQSITFLAYPVYAMGTPPPEQKVPFEEYDPHGDFAPELFDAKVAMASLANATEITEATVYLSLVPCISPLLEIPELSGAIDENASRTHEVEFPAIGVWAKAVSILPSSSGPVYLTFDNLPLGKMLRQVVEQPSEYYLTKVKVKVFVLPTTGTFDIRRCMLSREISLGIWD